MLCRTRVAGVAGEKKNLETVVEVVNDRGENTVSADAMSLRERNNEGTRRNFARDHCMCVCVCVCV